MYLQNLYHFSKRRLRAYFISAPLRCLFRVCLIKLDILLIILTAIDGKVSHPIFKSKPTKE